MRVLVVEDDQAVGEVFLDYLLELGHQPLLVRSAEAALGKLQTQRPDAILLDVNLPGMSGLEFLQLRRVRDSGVPVVAVSGVASESQARDCLRLGALDFVGKPVALERLSEVLECLEPHALDRPAGPHRADRRHAARVPLSVPVRVIEYGGPEWHAMSENLSPFGIKLRAREGNRPSKVVRLAFIPPDGGAPLDVMALLVREEPGTFTFFFVNLTPSEAQRLIDLIARLKRD